MSTETATTPPNARDFLNIDALLSDEELMLRDTVRRFVGDRVLPDIAEWFEQGILPGELAKEIGKLGLLGMHLEGYGCAGASSVDYGIACMELEAGDSNCADGTVWSGDRWSSGSAWRRHGGIDGFRGVGGGKWSDRA